jgi:hypothetical protein
MFDGIKLLCLVKKPTDFESCLAPIIVPAEKFLKIANDSAFCCPKCGHKSKSLRTFFMQAVSLQKAVHEVKDTGFYLSTYNLAFMNCHEDDFDATPHILEKNDWGFWNMQISNITLANIAEPASRIEIWEDSFEKANPFVYPHVHKITFNNVLHRKSLIGPYHEIKDLTPLQKMLRETRKYNAAWRTLLDSLVSAVPVDLRDQLYTDLNNVTNLSQLYPEETYG